MPNPRYKAFVEVAGMGSVSNREFIEFINQMRRLYVAQDGYANLFVEDNKAFDEFVKANAHLYVPEAKPTTPVSGSLIERTEP